LEPSAYQQCQSAEAPASASPHQNLILLKSQSVLTAVNTGKIRYTIDQTTRCCDRVLVASLRCKLLIERRNALSAGYIHPVTTTIPTFCLCPSATPVAMALFIFYPEYHVIVCKSCAYAVAPPYLATHIATKQANDICGSCENYRARCRTPIING
jgi:hypothetical protein